MLCRRIKFVDFIAGVDSYNTQLGEVAADANQNEIFFKSGTEI